MRIYVRLFWEFFKTGLFAVGGGMATLPFLKKIGENTDWYSNTDLMNMLAVSESTPGPIGINMATYVGFMAGSVPGAVIATLGEVAPSILVILLVAAMLKRFRDSQLVKDAFYGLRPASAGLIGAAWAAVALEVFAHVSVRTEEGRLFNTFSLADGSGLFNWPGLVFAGVLLVFTNWVKPTKKLHPVVFIAFSAAVGVLAGAYR